MCYDSLQIMLNEVCRKVAVMPAEGVILSGKPKIMAKDCGQIALRRSSHRVPKVQNTAKAGLISQAKGRSKTFILTAGMHCAPAAKNRVLLSELIFGLTFLLLFLKDVF